jgi:hypothetical protein
MGCKRLETASTLNRSTVNKATGVSLLRRLIHQLGQFGLGVDHDAALAFQHS